MTKTNLEIEEEFIQHLRSVGLNIQGETENLYRGVAQWWLSKLQQRMDEIEGELPLIDKAHTYASENADEYRAYEAGQEDYKKKVLNIIKSVDKK